MRRKTTLKVWQKIPILATFAMGKIYNHFFGQTLLIHTPKCGGTYLKKQYKIQKNWRIQSVGHAKFNSIKVSPKNKVVGLIRSPIEWYKSYYYFCKQSLEAAPQSKFNFPTNHPISLFSKNGQKSFEYTISTMANDEFLSNLTTRNIIANIYTYETKDLFNFIQRTESGFWSWSMIYHFSNKGTSQFRTKQDVLDQGKEIRNRVQFIHQENLDQEAKKLLNLKKSPGEKINTSFQPKNKSFDNDTISLINQLDGDLAYLLGGYK